MFGSERGVEQANGRKLRLIVLTGPLKHFDHRYVDVIIFLESLSLKQFLTQPFQVVAPLCQHPVRPLELSVVEWFQGG